MTATAEYTCRYCRLPSNASGHSCPNCGAPVDVRAVVSRSGWEEQPAIEDMARIQFGQSYLQIEGKQVPVADFGFGGAESIYFSHHVLLWADGSARMGTMPMRGGWNRMLAGMPLVMMTASGPGHVALSDNHAGEIVALPLVPGRPIWVREHRFLTATANITYDWENTNLWFQTGTGDDRETHHPLGTLGDIFQAGQSPGLLLLHSPGNTFIRDLQPGESILVQPSALLYRDLSVHMHLHLEYPQFQGFGGFWSSSYSHRYVWLRLSGPGRVAVQSIFARAEASERITGSSGHSTRTW
jgi:uncharacterized protein (AIM24 family)